MKNLFVTLITCIAIFATACVKEEKKETKAITVTASIEMSKTALNAGHTALVWTEGDRIGIFNNVDKSNTALEYSAGGPMQVSVPVGTTEIYAVYPYDENVSYPFSIDVATEQTQAAPGVFPGQFFPMIAKASVNGDEANLVFRPVAGALAFNLYHTELSAAESVLSLTVIPSEEGRTPVKTTLTSPLSLGNAKPADSRAFEGQIYVCLPKESYAGLNLAVQTDKDSYSFALDEATELDLEAHDMIPVNVDLAGGTETAQGFKLSFQMEGIHKLELECVDGYPLTADGNSILSFVQDLEPGKEYTIGTVPCDVYGGYRLSIFKDDKVAHFFGVHQVIEEGTFISPLDLDESELEFDDPDAPLVEEERPELDKRTKELLRKYKQNPTDENYQALYDQMGVRYDKVVARKKAKLRELEREAHHQSLIDEMQGIVDEMVNNREERLWQRFLSLIDSRKDDDPNDEWCVLKGAWQENAYIGYAPVTNADYKAYKADYTYASGQDRYPVVNISYSEAVDYCNWLSANDAAHAYRLPSEYEWILAAGHMPKDVNMNANHVESGLTSVDAYAGSVGNCGGIDFWGNCWEWTSTLTESGKYIIKGGAWDSSRDECRSEYSDASRDGAKGYANVGFRVVRVDSQELAFASSSCTADGYTIPYRYAQINPREGVTPSVVLVLHGGPLMGDDNETQLEEAATGILCNYLENKGMSAVLLAPQCPQRNSLGYRMNWVKLSGVLYEMVLRHRADENTPAFIFGASIGGVGTWNMLSTYPGLFTGAMPCASNPTGCDAANVAKTRVYPVMGTEDTWAPLEQVNLQAFLDEVAEAGGTYRYDIGEGWDHETTCQQSFTAERLDWVFGASL